MPRVKHRRARCRRRACRGRPGRGGCCGGGCAGWSRPALHAVRPAASLAVVGYAGRAVDGPGRQLPRAAAAMRRARLGLRVAGRGDRGPRRRRRSRCCAPRLGVRAGDPILGFSLTEARGAHRDHQLGAAAPPSSGACPAPSWCSCRSAGRSRCGSTQGKLRADRPQRRDGDRLRRGRVRQPAAAGGRARRAGGGGDAARCAVGCTRRS